jgi:hypothetical protein
MIDDQVALPCVFADHLCNYKDTLFPNLTDTIDGIFFDIYARYGIYEESPLPPTFTRPSLNAGWGKALEDFQTGSGGLRMSNATKSEKDVRVKFLIDEIRVFVGEMLRRKHGDGIRNFCKTLSEPVLTTDAEFPLAITEEAAREDDTTVRPFSDVNESLRKQLPSEEQFSTPSENDAVLQDQQNDHAPIITIHGICWVAEYMREMRPLESDLSETLPMSVTSLPTVSGLEGDAMKDTTASAPYMQHEVEEPASTRDNLAAIIADRVSYDDEMYGAVNGYELFAERDCESS